MIYFVLVLSSIGRTRRCCSFSCTIDDFFFTKYLLLPIIQFCQSGTALCQVDERTAVQDILVACECAGEWPSILVCRVLPFTPSCATPWSSPYAAVRRRKVIRTQNRSQRILNLHGLQYAMSFDLTMVGQWTDMSTNEKERKKKIESSMANICTRAYKSVLVWASQMQQCS